MQTLDLYIKNGIRIDIDTIMLFDIFGQTQLILILDLLEFLAGSGIIRLPLMALCMLQEYS